MQTANQHNADHGLPEKPTLFKGSKDYIDLMVLKKRVRDFLHAIECVPFRAVDCNQDRVDFLIDRLKKLSGYRGRR